MNVTPLIRQCRAALVGVALLVGCSPAAPVPQALTPVGRDVILPGGIGFTVPNAFHETPSKNGRTFRMRGGLGPSYDTIVVQTREPGAPVLLDEALSSTLARLRALEHFDLLDVQLIVVGPHLGLSYAADFDLLEVRRRQWGVVLGTPEGLVAFLMTSPHASFLEASPDYQSLLDSLHTVPPPHHEG